MSIYNYDSNYYLKQELINNEEAILLRVQNTELINIKERKTLENLLRFLYMEEHIGKAVRKTIQNYQGYFSEAERLMLFRLETRCTGSERFNYGINAISAIKRDKYECVICAEKDVRCLEIDHINGRTHKRGNKEQHYEVNDFQTLCANHHRIKTVVERQQN